MMAKTEAPELLEIERLEHFGPVEAAAQRLEKVRKQIRDVESELAALESDGDVSAAKKLLSGEEVVTPAARKRELMDRLRMLQQTKSVAEGEFDETVRVAFRKRYQKYKTEHHAMIDEVADALARLIEAVRREEQFRHALGADMHHARLEPVGVIWRACPGLPAILRSVDLKAFRRHQQAAHE